MTTTPHVRDFTRPRKTLDVELVVSPVCELVLSLFTYDTSSDLTTDEAGTLRASINAEASPELVSELDRLRSCGEVWLPLIGIATAHGATTEVAEFLELLGSIDPVALRGRMIRNSELGKSTDQETIDAAAEGDADAISTLVGDDHPGIEYLLRLAPAETRSYLIDLIRRYDDEVFGHRPSVLAVLERDAAEKRSLAGSMPPEKLVERATNGVTFKPQPEITGVILIPSVVVRPWVVITDHGDVRIFCYPVAEEHLTADPDSPPSYVVDFYKALGDEKRLHILSVLAEGPAGLKELAERLDLAKSTVHHHLRILRTAGLVRVTVGDDDKTYSLRTEALPHAGTLLQGFLSGRHAFTKGRS